MLLACCGLAAQSADQAAPLRLSLRDALQIALQNNLQVDIARQTREATMAGVQIAQGAFDWNANALVQTSKLENATTAPSGFKNTPPIVTETNNYQKQLQAGLTKAFTWGGSLNLIYNPAWQYESGSYAGSTNPAQNGPFSTSYPYYSQFTATYNQNLLQGFGTEITTAPLVIARKQGETADYTFQLAMINLVAATEGQYWAVVQAQRQVDADKLSLQTAQKQLDENNIRLKVGTMAPLDIVSAEAQVASAEQTIIGDQAKLDNAKDALIRALYNNAPRPAGLELTDQPNLGHSQLSEDEAVKMALERRLELKQDALTNDVNRLNLTVAQDKVRPSLGAFVTYTGNTNDYNSFGPTNSDLAKANYPGYTVGLKFAMPIQNNAAKGGVVQARANLREGELNMRSQQLDITLAARTAVRSVKADEESVKAAAKTVYFQEQTLEAEQKKFDNGMSTNFNVLQDMSNLDAARSKEIQAQIQYANDVTALEQAVGDLLEARNFTVKP
jgi:outer membrane protein TolC